MIYIDLILVVFIFFYLRVNNQILFLNPAFLFFLFHFLFLSLRGIQIFFLNSKLITNTLFDTNLTFDEIEKGLLVSDITLVSFVLGFYLLKKRFIEKGNILVKKQANYKEKRQYLINIYIKIVVIIGLLGVFFTAFIPYLGYISVLDSNIYVSFLSNLGIIAVVILIYEKGFNKKIIFFLVFMVVIYSIQGFHRYRVILPLLFLLNYYLKLRDLRFPPIKYIVLGVFLIIMSFPLKQIGRSLQNSISIDIVNVGVESIDDIVKGKSGDLSFLEQGSAIINTVESRNMYFYGETYISILFFWIPRDVWKQKPILNEWMQKISTKNRNYGQMGMISLLAGESYANFALFGAFLIPFLLGRFYSYLYFTYYKVNVKHRGFLLLLIFNMILFQVWRDGLISLFLFPLLNYLPLMILFILKSPSK